MRPRPFISEVINRSMMICRYVSPPPSRHVLSHINLHCPRCIRFTTVAHHSVPCWACRSLFIPVSPYQTRLFLGFGPLFQVGPFPSSSSSYQGCCRVGVETGVGVDRRRRFWPEPESELDSVNFANSDFGPALQDANINRR